MTCPTTQPREEARFLTDWNHALKAELILKIDDDARIFPATVADVSLTGCAVRADLPQAVRPQVAVLRVLHQAGGTVLEAAGRVCWDRQTSMAARKLGLKFRRALPERLLQELIQQGWVSRREHPREHLGMAVNVRRTAGKSVVQQAGLSDRSRTGVQLATDQLLEIGERVLVTLPADAEGRKASGMVAVVWSRKTDLRCEAGGIYVNLTSSHAISEAVPVVS